LDRHHDADLVLGPRVHRHDPIHRLVLTRFTRAAVSVIARRHVRVANLPFELIRRSLYEHLRPSIPAVTFAPSLMLVLGAHRSGARVLEIETTHLPRMHGQSTLRLGLLARTVAGATRQTVQFSLRSIDRYDGGPDGGPGV